MKAYVIDWLDHYDDSADTAWSSVEKIDPKPCLVRSVGFVVKQTTEVVTIAHSYHGGECSSPFHILRSCIVRMEPITLPPLRREPNRFNRKKGAKR